MCLFAPDSTRLRIVMHHMPGAVIRSKMIFHGCIGMCKCDVYKTVVSTFLTCPGKEFQVHHVINNDRELPFIPVVIPGTNAAHFRVKPGNQRFSTSQQNAPE